jgi:mannan endo-1,4-beta-mannosidase
MTMSTMRPVLLLLVLAIAGIAGVAVEPADPAANARVRAILDHLAGLERRTDKRLLSGQYSDVRPDGTAPDLQSFQDRTGHAMALAGFDYFLGGRASGPAVVNRAVIAAWKQGSLVTISAHCDNPMRAGGGGLRDKPIDLRQLLGPEGEVHQRWMKTLDIMADGLQELRDQGVVVLWRPFHEMNGGWFWWGKSDPAVFHQVWKQMFDHYAKVRKLDNLIWVYGPNHGEKTAAYYAGDRYVDVVGFDAYTDFVDREHIKGYDEIAALPKPFGFTEYGPFGPHKPPGDYDYRRFIAGVIKDFPRTTFMLAWCAKWSIGLNRNGKEFLEHPWLVNRADLPAALFPDRR